MVKLFDKIIIYFGFIICILALFEVVNLLSGGKLTHDLKVRGLFIILFFILLVLIRSLIYWQSHNMSEGRHGKKKKL